MALVFGALNLAHSIRLESAAFDLTQSVPAASQKGMDFAAVFPITVDLLREGVSSFLRAASEMRNVYAPFFTVFVLPLAFFSPETAYALWTVMLHAALIALIGLALRSAKDLTPPGRFFAAVCFSTIFFQTYPFLFTLERGNGDLIAILFGVLALFSLTSSRPGLAPPLLAVAFQLKLYPAILALFIFGKRGWRQLLAFSAWAVAGFFVLGVDAFVYFAKALRTFTKIPFLWAGNHSMASYVYRIHEVTNWPLESTKLWGKALLAGFALFFAWSCFRAYGIRGTLKGPYTVGEKALAGMAFQFMSLIPSTSHDYKLVIQFFPFLWLVSTPFAEFRSSRAWVATVAGALALCIGFLMAPLHGSMGIKTSALLLSFCCYAAVFFSETRVKAA